jgi:hypothetical protein
MKRNNTRYYSEDDFETGVTRSQLKRFGRQRQAEYMRYWFAQHFEDPAQETPYNSREGGYLFIWGGPYNAFEELGDEFGDFVSEERIKEVVDYVESDGTFDWAPGTNHSDHQQARDEWEAEHDENEQEAPLDNLIRLLRSGTIPQFGSESERAERQAILGRLDQLDAALAALKPAHGGLGHNNPPADDDIPVGEIKEAKEASTDLRRELVKNEPDALAVVQATSRLKIALCWFLKKADITVDAFAKAVGDTTGKAVVAVAGVYVTAELLPKIAQSVSSVIALTTKWLQNVTVPL